MLLITFFILILFTGIFSQNTELSKPILKILVFNQANNNITYLLTQTSEEIKKNNKEYNCTVEFFEYYVNDDFDADLINITFNEFYEKGFTYILDLTWNYKNADIVKLYAESINIIYLKIDLTVITSLKIIDEFLRLRKISEATIIFENKDHVEKALSYWLNRSNKRIVALDGTSTGILKSLNNSRVIPSFYVLIGSTTNISSMLRKVQKSNVIAFPERLVLFFTDFVVRTEIKLIFSKTEINLISFDPKMCCFDQNNCNVCPSDFNITENFIKNLLLFIMKTIRDLNKTEKIYISSKLFYENIKKFKQNIYYLDDETIFRPQLEAILEVGNISGKFNLLGKYNYKNNIVVEPEMIIKPIKRFYRISTGFSSPWIYDEKDPKTGLSYYKGYCVDFIKKLAEVMNFDYEFGLTTSSYGTKFSNGTWDGMVSGLLSGQIDMIVAPMTVTAEREEVVDFVTPIFATTGLTMVTRKPVRKTSFFKFLQVLDLKLWLTIIGALISTSILLWILHYCSPFSSKNRKYFQECREFNLKECFWFALTSFTPQGGGEPPMSFSGRIFVGTYWIFVVLILATFTANLSAFLTVERVKTQVADLTLDGLLRQSRINYTVVYNSWPHAYFKNMENTENDIFGIWRSLSHNKTTDRYRVWEYPIKEQYSKILKAITESVPVKNASEGYRKVLENTDGDFVFIHDYSEIRYAMARICHLVEVGKPFAERRYAVAVQQGSSLRKEIGQVITDLQKDGYFEQIKNKYWPKQKQIECPDDISEGISINSLGGVFISTIFVLILSIISLILEMLSLRKIYLQNKTKHQSISNKTKESESLEIYFTKANRFQTNFENRNMKIYTTANKSSDKSIVSQVSFAANFRPVIGRNFRDAGVTVVKGNYFTVHPRRPIHFNKDLVNDKPFLP